jgi:hypothetical protein
MNRDKQNAKESKITDPIYQKVRWLDKLETSWPRARQWENFKEIKERAGCYT